MESAKQNKNTSPKQNVILDTNILQYISTDEIFEKLQPLLKTLLDAGFGLSISDISVCELLSGLDAEREKKSVSLLENIPRYKVQTNVLIGAARLQFMYKKENIQIDSINLGDRIIASTSILTGSLILTANVNDFPRPFFIEKYCHHLIYERKNKEALLVLQLLGPDIQLINKRFSDNNYITS